MQILAWQDLSLNHEKPCDKGLAFDADSHWLSLKQGALMNFSGKYENQEYTAEEAADLIDNENCLYFENICVTIEAV